MAGLFGLCVSLAIALVVPGDTAQPKAPGAVKNLVPVIQLPAITQDGGVVEEGTVLKYRFTVTNTGQADLALQDVKPSCGCTVPRWDKLIKPGEKGTIDAEVHTERFRGPILKHLTVITNDPEHPQIELTLTAKITPLVEIEPGTVALLTVDEKPVTQVFTLTRTGNRPMKIVQVLASAPYLKTEVTPLPGNGRYKLAVTVTTEVPMGRSPTPVIVRTDLPNVGDVPLTLMIDRGIVTTPMVLFWLAPPGELKTPVQSMLTIMRQNKPFHVKRVSVDDPKLQAKLETVREGREYRVALTYSGGYPAGTVRKTLSITTDDPKQPELIVPIHGMIKDQVDQAPVFVVPARR
jgi:hypothetical protein